MGLLESSHLLVLLFLICIHCAIFGIVGLTIGRDRKIGATAGFWLGACLGIIGLVIILCSKSKQIDKHIPTSKNNVNYIVIIVLIAAGLIVAVILLLLATDTYLYLQKNKADTYTVTENGEKSRLQIELDSLHEQLITANAGSAKPSADWLAKDDSLESAIKGLQQTLTESKLTQRELDDVSERTNQLKYNITSYEAEIADLEKNRNLTGGHDTLKTSLSATLEKDKRLNTANAQNVDQIKIGSAIKAFDLNIISYSMRGNSTEIATSRSSAAKKIKIKFTVATNDIAQKGRHDIYIRVIDPDGNLIAESDSGNFSADGQDVQYTYKSSIEFQNDNRVHYTIDWTNPVAFQKGVYTVLLYADGYTMGKGSFELK